MRDDDSAPTGEARIPAEGTPDWEAMEERAAQAMWQAQHASWLPADPGVQSETRRVARIALRAALREPEAE